jgi:hypothetical protein
MGRACGTQGGEKIFTLGLVRQRKNKNKKHMEGQRTEGRMILKWI